MKALATTSKSGSTNWCTECFGAAMSVTFTAAFRGLAPPLIQCELRMMAATERPARDRRDLLGEAGGEARLEARLLRATDQRPLVRVGRAEVEARSAARLHDYDLPLGGKAVDVLPLVHPHEEVVGRERRLV